MFEGRMLLAERSKYWWVELIAGIGWLIIAWLVLRANVTSLATVGLLIGVLFIVAGLNEAFVGTLVGGGWRVLHYVMAAIFLLGGLWALIRPVNTFFALVVDTKDPLYLDANGGNSTVTVGRGAWLDVPLGFIRQG